jgi:hypothetical protein
VVARLFGWKHKPKFPENRQLDPCPDRHRRHTRHIAPPWNSINIPRFDEAAFEADDGFILLNRKAIWAARSSSRVAQIVGKALIPSANRACATHSC